MASSGVWQRNGAESESGRGGGLAFRPIVSVGPGVFTGASPHFRQATRDDVTLFTRRNALELEQLTKLPRPAYDEVPRSDFSGGSLMGSTGGPIRNFTNMLTMLEY